MNHSPFLFAAILSIYLTPVQSSNGDIQEFNDYINTSISKANIAGMCIAIVSGDSILYLAVHGEDVLAVVKAEAQGPKLMCLVKEDTRRRKGRGRRRGRR